MQKKVLTDKLGCGIINSERERNTSKKGSTKMTKIDFNTYCKIADLLTNDDLGVDDIAKMVGVSADVVKYVDRAENDVM